jgi:hypothetical protein
MLGPATPRWKVRYVCPGEHVWASYDRPDQDTAIWRRTTHVCWHLAGWGRMAELSATAGTGGNSVGLAKNMYVRSRYGTRKHTCINGALTASRKSPSEAFRPPNQERTAEMQKSAREMPEHCLWIGDQTGLLGSSPFRNNKGGVLGHDRSLFNPCSTWAHVDPTAPQHNTLPFCYDRRGMRHATMDDAWRNLPRFLWQTVDRFL